MERKLVMSVLGLATLASASILAMLIVLLFGNKGELHVNLVERFLLVLIFLAALAAPFVMAALMGAFVFQRSRTTRRSLIGLCVLISAAWAVIWLEDQGSLGALAAPALGAPLAFASMLHRGREVKS